MDWIVDWGTFMHIGRYDQGHCYCLFCCKQDSHVQLVGGGWGAYIHVHVHVYSVYASLVCVLIENMRDPILVMRCYRFCFVPLMYPRPSPQFSP